MKAPILTYSLAYICITIFSYSYIASPLLAFEYMLVEDGSETTDCLTKINKKNNNFQAEAKIAYLSKLIEQSERRYESKIKYLEFELKKSTERIVAKSINNEKTQHFIETKHAVEITLYKRELIVKTKTMLEYQRQLEKINPSEDFKKLIKLNTDLSIEIRRNADQLAKIKYKYREERNENISTRKPSSATK